MKNFNKSAILLGVALVLHGCASMPDKTITYYLPKSTVNVTATQSVLCIDPSHPIVETNIKFDTEYSANRTKPNSINFSDLDTFYSTGTASITLTQDGRLEGFNSSSTGAVSDVISTLISFLPLTKTASEKTDLDGFTPTQAACNKINQITGGKPDKPLSIVLTSKFDFSDLGQSHGSNFEITGYPQDFYKSIVAATGALSYGKPKEIDSKSKNIEINSKDKSKGTSTRKIIIVEPAIVSIEVIRTSISETQATHFQADIPVPQWGTSDEIPIPKPPMFGTNTLDLTLFESGKIKTLKYGSTNGAKDLGAAFKALGDSLTKTDAEKTLDLKNQADLIAAQQRLLKCKTTAECK